MPLTRTVTTFNFRERQIKITKVMDIHGKTAAACLINWMSTIKIVFKYSTKIGSTDVTGEIIHVNIVVGKVGPIRKMVFVPRNTEEFDIFVMPIMAWENRHGRPRMWPKYLIK